MATDEIITRTVIAATPGWFVAQFEKGGTFNDNHEDKLNYYAVIAWEIERRECSRAGKEPWVSQTLTPLMFNGSPDDYNAPWALKTPNGNFEIREHASFDNEAETIRYLAEIEAQDAKALAAAAARKSAQK